MSRFKRYLLAAFLGVCLGGIVYAVVFHKKTPIVKTGGGFPPEVMSCVKKVKVINRRIDAALNVLVVEVENTSDLGIVAISLESKKGSDSYSVVPSTFEADEPIVIIKPHERYELTIELNLTANASFQVGSVVYADGTEDGCQASIGKMRKLKADHEQIKAQRKGSK